MEVKDRKSQILNILAKSIRRVIETEVPDFDRIQENQAADGAATADPGGESGDRARRRRETAYGHKR